MLEKNTELGDIRFSRNVIFRIVEDAADMTDGAVTIHNYKGKYKSVMPVSNITFTETEGGVEIIVFVVIKFGASISGACKAMIDYINENTEKLMGERPYLVKIIVTGVQSNEIAKRHIEITDAEAKGWI
ncbi:MAG: Asp23/Gls24 family envelope stress response protein [Eubacteriales bacterium]|nr:Asp23/Gls24 family envelope stress response protein [Eubacteriales bacterium]